MHAGELSMKPRAVTSDVLDARLARAKGAAMERIFVPTRTGERLMQKLGRNKLG